MGLSDTDIEDDLSTCDPEMQSVEEAYEQVVESLHSHQWLTAVENLPTVLAAIKAFVSECKGTTDFIKFSQDIEEIAVKIIAIEGEKLKFLDNV